MAQIKSTCSKCKQKSHYMMYHRTRIKEIIIIIHKQQTDLARSYFLHK